MLSDIKKAVYSAIKKLDYDVYDRLPKVDKYPYIILTTSSSSTTRYKNSREKAISFTIDIFSNYRGEQEIYDIEQKIEENMSELLALGQVITIDKEQFAIINDTNPIVKHGVVVYEIKIVEV